MQAVAEGSTEALQETVSMLVEKAGHSPELSFSTSESIARIVEASIAGFALGGTVGAVKGTGGKVIDLKDKLNELKRQNDEVKQRLQDKGVSPEDIQIVDENMSDFEKQLFLMEDNVSKVYRGEMKGLSERKDRLGFYTPQKEFAEGYGDILKEREKPQNTLEIFNPNQNFLKDQEDWDWSYSQEKLDELNRITGENIRIERGDIYFPQLTEEQFYKLKDAGYDSIFWIGDEAEYYIFDDNQAQEQTTVDPLIEEARKYDTAEEFVESQGVVYHSTDSKSAIEQSGFTIDETVASTKPTGVWFTDKKQTGYGAEIVEAIPPKNLFEMSVLDMGDLKKKAAKQFPDLPSGKAITETLKSEGYDGLKMDGTVVIFDPKNIKTKKQLTDIWNQAQEQTTVDPLIEEARKYDTAEEFVESQYVPPKGKIYLYRGMETEFDPSFNLADTDAPQGYSTWTDNPELAKQYAGDKGHIYKIELSKSDMGRDIVDADGERPLFLNNEKKAGLNNISGDEYLVYTGHDKYSPNLISSVKTGKQLTDIWNQAQEQTTPKSLTKEIKESKIPDALKYKLTEGIEKAETTEALNKIKERFDLEVKTAEKKPLLRGFIKERQFERVENLRKALKMPTIEKMTLKQVMEFAEILRPYEVGDRFLTERQIETVDKTDLKGIKTIREARQKLADELNVPVEDVMNIQVSELDRIRYDTALARKNPVYKMIVEEYQREILGAEAEFLQREETINDLTKKARKSRKRGLKERIVPTDKLVFQYLEAKDKTAISQQMTKEELELAEFIQNEYAKALEYLIKTKALETGRENYITNIRRGFVEALADDGIKSALRETLDNYQLDEQKFDILDQMTDQILPLEKFFQFAMKRTGGIKPTQNVAKAVNTYFKTFEKKRALDSFIPKMMIYVDAISPKKETPRGLEADQKLKTFVKEWINTKKGRPTKLLVKPGGRIDRITRAMKAYTTVMDLGFNIPVGMAATVGESVATYVSMGKKDFAKGLIRMNTPKGKAIAKKYKNFIGKSVWEELSEPSKNLNDKVVTAMFGFFTESAKRSNKQFLLGSMTKEEYEAGEISPKRLAELKVDMGRYRKTTNDKSIIGSTTEGGLWTQYKSWAIPILSTTASNIKKLSQSVYSKDARKKLTGKEIRDLWRQIEVTAAALIAIAMIPDDDDDSFIGELTSKVKREALTILGALDPVMYTSEPRMLQFVGQLGMILKDIVTLEEYSMNAPHKLRGKLKGVEKAKKVITPRAIKSITKEK